MPRISTEEELTTLVSSIVKVLPEPTEEAVKQFLDARFIAYNKSDRVDAHLKLKAGKTFLPYPYNVQLVARLYDNITESDEEDPYDI